MAGEKVVSAEMWSTPSGSAHLMMPREMMDIPVVAPSTTKPSSKKRAAAGVSSDEPEGKRPAGGALEWRGPCCGGTMVWGKGNGYKPARGGDREYRCGNSGCRKLLPKPSTQDILDDLALDKAIREAECLAAALL